MRCPTTVVLIAMMPALSASSAASVASENYTVQLLADLAPAGFSASQWAAAADAMIGKTQAHIISDLIEDLGIKLKVTEASIRGQINKDREKLGLDSLTPFTENKGGLGFLKYVYQQTAEEEAISNYLPLDWTEDKLSFHTSEEFQKLDQASQVALKKRLAYEEEAEADSYSLGFLSELPRKDISKIQAATHAIVASQLSLSPGVRAYKRSVAPLTAIVQLQQYEHFGFVLYRTSYKSDTGFEKFVQELETIIESQMRQEFYGDGLELIVEGTSLWIEDDKSLDGATAEDCRRHFRKLRKEGDLGPGFDTGVLLMVDDKSIQSLADFEIEFEKGNPPNVWAVDIDFDPKKNDYHKGYEGSFEVRPSALMHHLFVGLAGGMTPIEVWETLQRKPKPEIGIDDSHDEL